MKKKSDIYCLPFPKEAKQKLNFGKIFSLNVLCEKSINFVQFNPEIWRHQKNLKNVVL